MTTSPQLAKILSSAGRPPARRHHLVSPGDIISESAGEFVGICTLFEAIAVAVHFEDVDVVGEPIEQRAGQALGPEHAGPFVERQIGGDNDGAALVTLAEDLEQQLRAGR